MDPKRIHAIKKAISCAIQCEQDAYDIIEILSKEDWSWWLKNTNPVSRWKDKPCVVCKKIMKDAGGPLSGMCQDCFYQGGQGKKVTELSVNRSRAKNVGLPYTLTLREWYTTLEDFQYKCAYCLKKNYECLEHFVPISLGGGTTRSNCVPSCYKCNNAKKQKHPSQIKLISKENIERVQKYLAQFEIAP